MKKKNFITGIAVLLCMTLMLATTAFAAAGETGVYNAGEYNLTFTVNADGQTASITGFETQPESAVALVIPEKVALNGVDYTVTEIADNAFNDTTNAKDNISSVDFPATITTIGEYAFQRQINITTFTVNGANPGVLPERLTRLGKYAFFGTDKLDVDLVFPNSLKVIEEEIFHGDMVIKSVKLGNAVESIAKNAFYNLRAVTELELPATLKTLDLTAFNRMAYLDTLTVKSTEPIELSISYQNSEGIYGWDCTRTGTNQGGNIGGAVTRTGTVGYTNFVFDDLDVLKAFANECCVNANGFNSEDNKKYFIGNNFKYSGASTFTADKYSCEGIGIEYEGTETVGETTTAVIKIATTVTGLASAAAEPYEIDFTNGITDADGNTYFVSKIDNGVDNVGAFEGDTYLTKVKTGSAMTLIGPRTFYGCTGLEEAVIDEGLLEMGLLAFSDCTGLKKASIPSTITKWNSGAFRTCWHLTDLTFAEGLTTIGNGEFYMARGLENIVIPASVTSVTANNSGIDQQFLKNVIFKGDTLPEFTGTILLENNTNVVTFYVKNETVKAALEAKLSAIDSTKYNIKLLSDCDAVAYYNVVNAWGISSGFVYAEQPIDATYYFVQYDDSESAQMPIKQIFVQRVSLGAGEHMTFDVANTNKTNGQGSIFLLGNETLKPHINKTAITWTDGRTVKSN